MMNRTLRIPLMTMSTGKLVMFAQSRFQSLQSIVYMCQYPMESNPLNEYIYIIIIRGICKKNILRVGICMCSPEIQVIVKKSTPCWDPFSLWRFSQLANARSQVKKAKKKKRRGQEEMNQKLLHFNSMIYKSV